MYTGRKNDVRRPWLVSFLVVGVTALAIMFLSGCVSSEDKARLKVLDSRVVELEKQAIEVRGKIIDKTLSIEDAEKLYDSIRSDTAVITGEIKDLQSKGYSSLEIILAILERLAIVAASLGAVRLSRGSIHNRNGEAPA